MGSSRPNPSAFSALVCCLLLVLGGRVQAQEENMLCGWPESELQDGMPKTVIALRSATTVPVPEEALARLRAWIHTCSVHEGAQAVYLLKRFAGSHGNDPAIGTLYGVALAHGPEVQVVGAFGVTLRSAHKFSNAEKEAGRLFADIVSRSGSTVAANELATLALSTRAPKSLDMARTTLASLVQRNDTSASVWDALADVYGALDKQKESLAASQRALALHSARAARRSGIAMMLSDPEPSNGAKIYLDGLAHADPDVRELYYEDMALLLTDEETQAWDALQPQEQNKWLLAAWSWRASISSQTVPARLAQHFRRMSYAFEKYRRNAFRGARPTTALWLDPRLSKEPLDDRGLSYVRHGAPDDIVRIALLGNAREGWYYHSLAGGRALLEFNNMSVEGRQILRWGDHFLTEPFHCEGSGFAQVPHNQSPLAYRGSTSRETMALENYLDRINSLDPSLHADGCSNTLAGDSGRFTLRVASGDARRVMGHAIMETETATPWILKPLQALLNTYAFKRAGGTLIAAVGSMPGGKIAPVAAPGEYRMKLFAAIENSGLHDVVRGDTTYEVSRPSALTANDVITMPILLYGRPSATSTVRFSIRNVADTLQGQVLTVTREINAFGGNGLSLSDIVVGATRDGSWLPGTTAPLPLPGHRMDEGSTFRVFYEMYGLQDGQAVHVTMRILPGKAANTFAAIAELVKKRQALTIEFDDRVALGPNGAAAVQRDISADLQPGAYSLEVTVETAGGSVHAVTRTVLTVYGN
jgi:hypothetical protein